MDPEQPKPTPFRFTDPRQERIYRRLLDVGPGPAAFYRDACQLVSASGGLASTTHLVAHLLREIESALRDVLESIVKVSKPQRLSLPVGESVRSFVRSALDRILGPWMRGGQKTEIRAILRALGLPETDPVAKAWLRLVGGDQSLHGRAHRRDLAAPRPMDGEFRSFWDQAQDILAVVLDRFQARYAEFLKILDQLLAKTAPSKEDIKRLRGHLPNSPVAQGYFFERLNGVGWLEPLRKARFFRHPLGPEEDPEGSGVRLPGWPQSRYLARVARERPKAVLEIILEADPTTNGRVQADFLDAAKQMRADFAVKLAPQAAHWLESDYGAMLLMERITDLIVQLAGGGQVDGALTLARALVALAPGRSEPTSPFPPQPTPRIERWFYKDVLDRIAPVLSQTAGAQWLETACDVLTDAVRYSLRDDERKGPEDHSVGWRPAVEDHGQNETRDPVIDRLVVAVRDAAMSLVAQDASTVPRVVAALEARRFKIFRRIALHILRSFPNAGSALVVERLTSRADFDDLTLHHEYFHLARECFSRLDPNAQAIILGWIDAGPDVERVKGHMRERLERDPTKAELEDELDSWRFYKLAPFRDALTGVWRERFDQLALRFPARDHPDFMMYGSGAVYSGFPSPKNVEELRKMSLPELTAFLKTWEPGDGPLEASPEGLAQHLSALAKSDPERFATEAPQLKGLDSTYVRAVLDGLQQAVKDGKAIAWQPVLDLCGWVVAQPRDRVERKKQVREADPDWGWARKTVARLLDDGLASGNAEIRIDLRSHVWDVLQPLTEDSEPTPEYEAKYGGSNMDPSTLSINTVRGEAMHAAMRYGLWVHKAVKNLPDGAERLKHGFGEIPELKDVLERHLDVARDPSPAIRAVYGQWFPLLALLDEQWAGQNVSRIFPMEESNQPLWNAAWGPYVTFCQPYDNTFRLLGERYRHAVELLGSSSKQRVGLRENPENQLAEHLMQLYWRGRVPLDDGGIIGQFYSKASLEVRAYALEHIGRALSNTNGPVDAAILDRMKRLWEWRLTAARNSGNATAFGPELAAFGWWFRSGKLDDDWAMEQLKNALGAARQTHRDAYLVMERLADIAQSRPLKAVESAATIIAGDAEGWVARLHREEIRRILRTALGSDERGARQAASDLVNRLVAQGEVDFRDLLSGS
jgi:hypothetical protein